MILLPTKMLKIFDDVHTVGYILDDIRKVDFYKEMQPNDSYTKNR